MDHVHLGFLKTGLIILGVWPAKFADANPHLKRAYKVYARALQYFFFTFICTQYIEAYFLLEEDFQIIVNNLGVSLLYTITAVKVLASKSKTMRRLLDQIHELEQTILNSGDEEEIKIYMAYVNNNLIIDKWMYALGVITIIPFFVNPVIEEHVHPGDYLPNNASEYRRRPLPFHSWFPFDKRKFYHTAYFLHIVVGSYGCSFVVVVGLFFVALMIFCSAQLSVLKHSLRAFKEQAERMAENGVAEERAVHILLRHYVNKHKVLIRFVNDLNDTLKYSMLLDFTICSIQIAVLAFQIIFAGFSVRQIFAIEFLFSMVCQLFLFYWFANEILLESEGVSWAVYESRWYECSRSAKQIILLVMMRSQRPLILSVGPFYEMSTSTAIAILRASYSYVALMRQNYMRKSNL